MSCALAGAATAKEANKSTVRMVTLHADPIATAAPSRALGSCWRLPRPGRCFEAPGRARCHANCYTPISMFAAVAVVILNAHAITRDRERPEATAIAVVDGRLAYVGQDAQSARRVAGPKAEVIDVHGRTVMPGFNDAHAHFGLSITIGSERGIELPELDKRAFIERIKRAS